MSALFLLLPVPLQAETPLGVDFEAISISADEASEDLQPGILHFKGHFIMQTPDWRLESSQATVHGPPERPEKVYLQGAPARFLIKRNPDSDTEVVEATAPQMEYTRSSNVVMLSGGASLKLGDEIIQSAVIEYNIDTERYRAGGADGVLIEVPPVD